MEAVTHYEGFMLYRVTIPTSFPVNATLKTTVHDRGYVSVNGVPQGIFSRMKPEVASLNLTAPVKAGDTLDILVENQGRINYGALMDGDLKGILGNVTLENLKLTKWQHFPLDFALVLKSENLVENLLKGNYEKSHVGDNGSKKSEKLPYMPASIYVGKMPNYPFVLNNSNASTVNQMPDTFVNTTDWGKGQMYVNNFNLGKFWPLVGPQMTLFLPSSILNPRDNKVLVVELERPPIHLTMDFVDQPELNGHFSSRKVFSGMNRERP
jgi:beta-galactosidase